MNKPPLFSLSRTRVCSLLVAVLCGAALSVASAQSGVTEQKIIFVRHGEKPTEGLGQLNCQGLNRALALPAVVQAQFGRLDFVFASDPHVQKEDNGTLYNYLRPLLTVAPAAIQLGLPVNTAFGFDNIAGLQKELALPRYQSAVVLVGWEHKQLELVVKSMLENMGGDKKVVPRWKGNDFDSIYVLTVQRINGEAKATFAVAHEQLDGQGVACPIAVAKP